MCQSTTFCPPKLLKRVRFHERVKIVEIQRIDQILEEMGHESNSSCDHTEDDIGLVQGSLNSSIENHCDVFSSCFSSNPNKYGPLKSPITVSAMLLNSLALPSSKDRRWNGPEKSNSGATAFAPSVPVRTLSIDEIIESALTIIASPTMGAVSQHNEELSSRQNSSWDFAPVIPCRRRFATGLEDSVRRP